MEKDTKQDSNSPEMPDNKLVDLSALQGFDFATNWSESKSGRSNVRDFDRKDRKPRGNQADRKDRRPFKPGSFRKSEGSSQGEKERGAPRSAPEWRKPYVRPEIPKTVVEVLFFPEDNGFNALCKALRISTITYELFDIARTFLLKEERFHMQLRSVDEKPNDGEQPDSSLYVVLSDGLPFLSESAALEYAMANCLDYFFTAETSEVEAPSGSFNSIQKCGITGELLGPPNYHRLKKIMIDHHASRLSNMPFAKFESGVETIKDEEVIAAWLEKMKTQTTYTLKPEFGEARQFEDGETARSFAKANLASKLVSEVKSVHLDGSLISKIQDPQIKANLEFAWERQKRFPLETANLLRGRLRHQKFALYKKGTKGVSYVCAVKRRFREPNEALSLQVQKLIEFIEGNLKITAKELPLKFLGFTTYATDGESPPELTDDQKIQFKSYSLDFQWLLKEGYIAEYSDGTVFAHPAVEPAVPVKNKGSKKSKVIAVPPPETLSEVAQLEEQSQVIPASEVVVEKATETDVVKAELEASVSETVEPSSDPEAENIASEALTEEVVNTELVELEPKSDEAEVVEPVEENVEADQEENAKATLEVEVEAEPEIGASVEDDQITPIGETEETSEGKDPSKS
jgi:hypothetical protein